MGAPDDRRYAESHEWHKKDGDVVTIGITRHAVDELTDITYVELKPAGTTIDAGESVGEVESVKTTSDVYSAIAGEIVEINESLADAPETLNSDPFDGGWLVKIKASDSAPLDALMDAEAYDSANA